MNGPFEIHRDPTNSRVTVVFAAQCHQARTKMHEAELADLVEHFDAVACDLTGTDAIASEWLRWLARLTKRAQQTGKTLALVGMQESVRRTTDDIALRNDLVVVDRINEVWQL